MLLNKKGQLQELSPAVTIIVVVGLMLGVGLLILDNMIGQSVKIVDHEITVTNESWANASNSTLKALANKFVVPGSVSVVNYSGGETITSGNYTPSYDNGTMVLTSTSPYYWQNLNVTYKYYAQYRQSTQSINNSLNATGGFSTWLPIIIVVLATGIILALIFKFMLPGRVAH